MKKLFILLVLSSVAKFVTAQETENKDHKPKIRGAIMMANSHVPSATKGGKKVAIIPTWGFDVDYFFHPRWSVALQGDVKLQSFEMNMNKRYWNALILSRQRSSFIIMHLRHWSFDAGPGYEFERHENFFLIKLGTEYSFEIAEDFEIALNLMYESKEDVYDAWTFGIAFNTKLWEKK